MNPKAAVEWGTGILKPYSHLSGVVMETISFGAQLEFNWSCVLVDLLKAEPKAAIAMYEALSGGEARRSALFGAAEATLTKRDCALLSAIDRVLAPARRLRNTFVHHIWGASPDLPDVLLLIDPKGLRKLETAFALEKLKNDHRKIRKPIPQPEFDRSFAQVWSEKALCQARRAMREGLVILGDVARGFAQSRPKVAISDPIFHQLSGLPEIGQALHKMYPQMFPQVPT